MEVLFDYYEWQLYEDMKEVQEMCIQQQKDMWDLEYLAIDKKRKLYELWRMVQMRAEKKFKKYRIRKYERMMLHGILNMVGKQKR